MNFWRRWTGWITVEPVSLKMDYLSDNASTLRFRSQVEFLYCLMFTTSNVVRSNLFIDKVCRNDFNYTDEVCSNLYENKEEQIAVQKYTSTLQAYNGVLQVRGHSKTT